MKKSNVYYLCLISILMALTLVVKFAFNFFLILNGYPIDIYIIIFCLSLLCISSKKYAFFYLLVTPWLLCVIWPASVNFLDFLLEYIISLYIFFPLIYHHDIINLFFNKLKIKEYKLTLEIVFLAITLLIIFSIKLFLHTLCGYLWYTNNSWWASFLINVEIIGIIYLIDFPIILIVYPSIKKIYFENNEKKS